MARIFEMLDEAAEVLRRSEIDEPRREANSLLAFALEKNRTFLIAHPEYELSGAEQKRFDDFLRRRAGREPFQYITGEQEFYALDFAVSPDVLIPRPETELIVENSIGILRDKEKSRFCEVGIGSGCISIAILYSVKNAAAIGLDISENALRMARKNAERHAVLPRLDLRKSDVFEVLRGEKFDLIVSNPPYIAAAEIKNLQTEVRDFEPLNALTDGADGFSIIKRIIANAPHFLDADGTLLIEISFGQAAQVSLMFDRTIWRDVEFFQDLQGIPRVVKAVKL